MKKLLVVLLTLALCVSMLASCDFINNFVNNETTPAETTPGNTDTPPTYNVDAAADYVYNLYKNKNITASDFEVTSKVAILGAVHTVEWSVDTDKVTIEKKDDNTFIVNVDEESPEEVAYVLTATVKGGDKTATKTFNLTVPKYTLTKFEDYMAAKEGDNVVVKGIVVAINSKSAGNKYNHLFLADLEGKGGYYCYSMAKDPIADDGIELGMIVEVTGPVAPYSGMQEIKGGTARIIDSNKHEVAPVDITEKVANGESVANYVGMPVVMKGVKIGAQELDKETSQYLKFELNGVTSYIRTYASDFPTTLGVTNVDGVYTSANKAVIDEAHAAHRDWKANATGILVLYNSAPYLIPMDVNCFEYIEKIEVTAEQKIEGTFEELNIGTSFSSDTVIELPAAGATYADVLLRWASNSEFAVVADGKLTITVPDAATEAVITVTATCGDKTLTKDITIKLSKTVSPVKDIIDLGASQAHDVYTTDKYLVAGIITEVYNTKYGNMKITDEFGNILTIYGTYSADGSARYDAMESKPVAGDYVVIFGIVGQYNGTPQVKNGWIMSFTTPTSVKDAIDTGAAMEHNTYTEDKIIVSGVITEVYNTTYGNMKITDADGNILTIYGTYSATGADRYDKMSVQPVAGDTVVIYGILGQYNGTPQVKNGWIVAITAGGETPECTEHVDADGDEKCDNCGADVPAAQPPVTDDPAADSTLTIEQVLALGASKEHNVYTESKYYVSGVIVEVYNTQYGNMKIKDEAGNILTVYGTYSADGSARYDAMEVKPVAGDTITVYGIVGQYNGTPQVKNGWITAHTAAAPETPDTPDAPANEVLNITAVGGTLAEDGSQISWETDAFNVVVYKDASTSDIRVTDEDHFRCYAKTKFTLVGKTATPIVKVVFTVTETRYASVLVESATAAGYTATADGKVVTVVVNATSVEFVNGAQARINKIEVVYSESNTPEVPEVPEVNDPAADSTLSIKDAAALGASKEHNTYTEGKYYVTGVIESVANTTYGNMTIKDAEGNSIYLYGLYSADGATRYDAMEVKPVAGDTITVYGIIGQYNGTAQVKNGWMTAYTAGEGNNTPDTPAVPTPDAEGKVTYKFSNYEMGVQYAADEVHVLDDKVTVTTNDSHFTSEIRLYQQAENQYGPARKGTAVFQLASAAKSLSINAGGKDNPVEVYGSTNGTDWVLITTVEATSAYADYEITLGSTEYTYIKLAAVDGQARVASITIGF